MVDDDDDGGDDDDCGTAVVHAGVHHKGKDGKEATTRADGASILSRTGSSPKTHFFNWGINPPKSNRDATEEGAGTK